MTLQTSFLPIPILPHTHYGHHRIAERTPHSSSFMLPEEVMKKSKLEANAAMLRETPVSDVKHEKYQSYSLSFLRNINLCNFQSSSIPFILNRGKDKRYNMYLYLKSESLSRAAY